MTPAQLNLMRQVAADAIRAQRKRVKDAEAARDGAERAVKKAEETLDAEEVRLCELEAAAEALHQLGAAR